MSLLTMIRPTARQEGSTKKSTHTPTPVQRARLSDRAWAQFTAEHDAAIHDEAYARCRVVLDETADEARFGRALDAMVGRVEAEYADRFFDEFFARELATFAKLGSVMLGPVGMGEGEYKTRLSALATADQKRMARMGVGEMAG